MDLMVDIESLGKHNDSIILTIGAQLFDPSVRGWETRKQKQMHTDVTYDPYMNVRVDVDEQEGLGRRVEEEAMKWWAQQSKEAQHDSFAVEDRIPLKTALLELTRLAQPCKRVWARGVCFDFAILEHACEQTDVRVPWNFWDVRDARTIYSLIPNLKSPKNGHLAIEDCRNQILMLQDAFGILGVEQLK